MANTKPPYDQRIAAVCVRPLVNTWVHPNHITLVTLILALIGAGMLAVPDTTYQNWGALIFVLARFGDHFDGELARQSGKKSRAGYLFDYITGGISHGVLFLGIGFGVRDGWIGDWAVVLGAAAMICAIGSMFLNLKRDEAENKTDGDTVGYPGAYGFELEDGIYLFAPITWLGLLEPFFILSAAGAVAYTVWTLIMLLAAKRRSASDESQSETRP